MALEVMVGIEQSICSKVVKIAISLVIQAIASNAFLWS